jgi:hypothetical protein
VPLSKVDIVGRLRDAHRRNRLEQFDSEDRFTRFANEAPFVKRALEMSRTGREGINGKSVFTSFATEKDQDGNWEVIIYPNVQEVDGKLVEFSGRDSLRRALDGKNILKIPAGNDSDLDIAEKIRDAESAAARWTSGFSSFLGSQKGK